MPRQPERYPYLVAFRCDEAFGEEIERALQARTSMKRGTALRELFTAAPVKAAVSSAGASTAALALAQDLAGANGGLPGTR